MKLHFDPNLDFQLEAIESVCDIFRGQEAFQSEFTVRKQAPLGQVGLGFSLDGLGVGNGLALSDEKLLENLHEVQLRNGLPPSENLTSGDFTVEMETGTGKTYVYLRTIFELNKRYGFTKFVIVVPSIAIKEVVYKTLQITEEHFKSLYAGVPFDYFLYDSSKLGQVRNFATSSQIQIMVVTVGAINKKDVNNLYKDSEKTGGEKPIDLIKATRPIVIVDEPQSVDGGLRGRGKEALDAMNPLCTLRYSATHIDKHHMVYRLDAVDAYERKLVKQIEVASATVEDAHNRPYVRLVSVDGKGGSISAKVEVDFQASGRVIRRVAPVISGENLEKRTGRAIYSDCRIGEIRVQKGNEYIELRIPGGEVFLTPGEAYGDVDRLAVHRHMIRRTIREHLEKEKRLRPQEIKVLSLFFIDQVSRYREYDNDGNAVKGELARVFEEEYGHAMKLPDFRTLYGDGDPERDPTRVHNGYFSIDKKGGWTDTAENNQTNRDNAERAYNLIMKEKEKLLSFETTLKFIFSHSALREGWDNPNVFQICTLRDIRSERERRQTIGRGLRLCVNQDGRRLHGFDLNTLTVVATESYEDFAENLQKEIEQDTGIRFGVVESHQFAAIGVSDTEGVTTSLGIEKSKELWKSLMGVGYIDEKGRIQDKLRTALVDGSLELPEEFAPQVQEVTRILKRLAGRLAIKNADERRSVRPREAILHGPEFRALWDRIKYKTTYRVHFDNDRLIEGCARALKHGPPIQLTRLEWRKAEISIGKGGVEATEGERDAPVVLEEDDVPLPDILTELEARTHLTRRSIAEILRKSERLNDFRRNPQHFIELAAEAINRKKRTLVVDGIKYQRIGDDEYYAQELFEQEELAGYLKNLIDAEKSIYEKVVYESNTESTFADDLESYKPVKVYAKLPGWFTVPTPLGSYNPDWAVLIEKDGEERLYFVVETKLALHEDQRRGAENAKIECGRAHFEALKVEESPAEYKVAKTVAELMAGR